MTSHYKVPNHELDSPVTALAFDEVQHVVFTGIGAGKTITFTFDGETTVTIASPGSAVTAAQIQSKLEGLSNIQPGDVAVTGAAGGPFDVAFTGQYAGENVPQLVGAATEGTVTVTTTTQGGPNPLAVQIGTGDADATNRTDPLDELSPSAKRAVNASEFGDS